jgi:hypothetical protein
MLLFSFQQFTDLLSGYRESKTNHYHFVHSADTHFVNFMKFFYLFFDLMQKSFSSGCFLETVDFISSQEVNQKEEYLRHEKERK